MRVAIVVLVLVLEKHHRKNVSIFLRLDGSRVLQNLEKNRKEKKRFLVSAWRRRNVLTTTK